jgi:hypothetical protein
MGQGVTMYNTADVSEIGCLNLVGAILNQAIEDASRKLDEVKGQYARKELIHIQRDAEGFITSKRRVRLFLGRYGLVHVISEEYVVNKAKQIIKEGGIRARGNGRGREDDSDLPVGF